ncbi:SLATT domain-containing protein [Isoptericola cucumis]|uniref:SLATT domain-containing protein n=1 Tax=Isoptericola cucumis TaxID=1776856 RepID=UPI003207CDC1
MRRRRLPLLSSADGRETDDPEARKQLDTLEKRSYKTYRARQSACNRLGKRARAWNCALVALATSTTVASIGLLTDADLYGENGEALMVCVAVLSLVASLATTNMDYSGRSRDFFLNYRKIQRISVEMEEFGRQRDNPVTAEAVKALSISYQAILDETENHTPGDHLRHFSKAHSPADPYYTTDKSLIRRRRGAVAADFGITSFPYLTLALPLGLLVPLVNRLIP